MPIPGFSLIAAPEFITAAEAVELVVQRFQLSACTQTEACAWLSEQTRHGKLKLVWADKNPEYLGGLHLAGEGLIPLPRLSPGARTIDQVRWGVGRANDELDWNTGELRRRVRHPKPIDRKNGSIDPFKLTHDEGRVACGHGAAFDAPGEPEEWITEVLTYRFTVRCASLVAILDRVSVPLGTMPVRLSAAAEIVASRFGGNSQLGLAAIVEAAATARTAVYGKPLSKLVWQGDRIGSWIWQEITRGEATLSEDATVLSTHALTGDAATWSALYVFHADLERLMRELAGDRTAAETATGPAELMALAGELEEAPASDTLGSPEDGGSKPPSDTVALRREAGKWLAVHVAAGEHRDRDSTLEAMRAAHPGLGVRGSLAIWGEFTKANPQLQLSRRGVKLKRDTNN